MKPTPTPLRPLALVGLLVFALAAKGTTIVSSLPNPAYAKQVVALVESDYEIHPVTYAYLVPDSGYVIQMVIPVTIPIESDIPSILLGTEMNSLNGTDHALWIAGQDIRPLDLTKGDGWLWSRWLGWIHAESYPWIYSLADHGWVYVEAVSDTQFALYHPATKTWTYQNLVEPQWTQYYPEAP